ncbi:MAG: hypothetical protein AAFQ89_07510 [Cyanobacteria bacterium J06626_18]
MKRSSIIGAIFIAVVIWLSLPIAAGGNFNPDVANNQDLSDTVVPNHRSGRHRGRPHSGQCGCW